MGRNWELEEWRWQNIGISALVVAMHILLLRMHWMPQLKNGNVAETIFLHLLSLSEPVSQPVATEANPSVKLQQSSRSASAPTSTVLSVELSPELTSSDTAVSDGLPEESRAAIDWRETSESVAAEMAKGSSKETYRSLDSRPAGEVQWEKERKAQKEYARHYAGETQRFDDGEVITWINSRCYITNRPRYSVVPRDIARVCRK